ncbi:hypothetical protein JCM3770_001738 [Rhodotorula araucariae]
MDRKPKVEPTDSPSTDSPSNSPLPTSGGYHDYLLRASAPSAVTGTRFNVMKFAVTGDRVVDPQDESQFLRPVKLNRKDPRTVRRLTDEDRERHNQRAIERAARAAGVKMEVDGADSAAVKGEDGADAAKDGDAKADKEELDLSLVGKGAGGATSVQRRGPGGMFKKKTRRVFVSSEEARRLKREEWQPWVLEDDEGRERWIGRLEGGAGEIANKRPGENGAEGQAQTGKNGAGGLQGWRPAADSSVSGGGGSAYVAFVLSDNNDEFRVLPVNRWYRFNQGPKYLTLAEEEAEEEYARQQKSKDPERWVMHRRIAPAAPTSAPGSGAATPVPRASGSGSGGGGGGGGASLRSRMLANSAAGTRAPGVGTDATAGRPQVRAVITSGVAGGRGRRGADQGDDEFDYEEDFQDDEEGIAKIDDLADEQETKELEERIRREMRAVERPDEIPDDDDETEQARLNRTGKEIKKLVKKSDKSGAYESDDDEENPYASDDNDSDASAGSHASGGRPGSRAASPSAGARAASSSRPGSRAASPAAGGSAVLARRAASPASAAKRKRGDGAASDGEDGSKRRKGGSGAAAAAGAKSPSPAPPAALLTAADLIAYLRARPAQTSTTKDLLKHFGRALKDKRNKEAMGGLLKAVADFKDGSLVLKAGL